MKAREALALGAWLVGCVAACDHRERDEARTLALVIDRYRAGTLDERPARAAQVVGAACTHPLVCETKAACLKSIEPLLEGLALKERAKREVAMLADGSGDLAKLEAIDKTLAQASERVGEAERMRDGCDRALEKQKRTFGY